MGRYELAPARLRDAIKNKPRLRDYVNRSAAYEALGRYDEALRNCERRFN